MERRWGVRDFEWDDDNEEHIARHGVTPAEVEEVFFFRFSVRRGRQGRYLVLGRSAEARHLSVVIEKLGGGWVRVVTARACPKRSGGSMPGGNDDEETPAA